MVLQLVTSQSNDDFVTMAMSLPANQQVCHSVYLFYFFSLCITHVHYGWYNEVELGRFVHKYNSQTCIYAQ